MTKPDAAPTSTPPASPTKRRTRGPNKPKPAALIDIKVDASMPQSAIIKVLTEYATNMQDAETAEAMELQVLSEGIWVTATDNANTPKVRFSTKGSR